MNTVWTINLFYPLIAFILIVLIIAISSVIKSRNGNMTFKDMFSKSSDNAKEITIDTTNKMTNMHNEVVKMQFTSAHEAELHKLEFMVNDLNQKFDLLLERVIKLENK